jgi:hypothetical protein
MQKADPFAYERSAYERFGLIAEGLLVFVFQPKDSLSDRKAGVTNQTPVLIHLLTSVY